MTVPEPVTVGDDALPVDALPVDVAVRRHVVVTGRVQGVTFRESTRRQAEGAGVAGWVRNLPDGSVEAELEGVRPAVEAVLRWMHSGPGSAEVDDVQVGVIEPTGGESFEVR